MATYHFQINTGAKGTAAEHSLYIQREDRFTEERYGEVEARGQENMPEWAREDRVAFWRASDAHERANGNAYREYELALPRELSRAQQIALVQRFAEQELGTSRPYEWAIHAPMARDGKEQPHVHLMFSDRQLDGIERGPEQFFKRYNAKHPELGGCKKATYGANPQEAALVYEGIRARWANVQNLALEHEGLEVRVDHRSLQAQGIWDREPELHRGPAVSGIEARGEVSEVALRQREQRLERGLERESLVMDVRTVTREEMALERVAVRARRELALEVTGPEREIILPRIEADRREQIERARACAERRIERRLGQGIGGQLLEQARELRHRIGEQLGRVKEWVLERFPEPLRLIKERSQELVQAVVELAPRGMFEGLKLKGPERDLGVSRESLRDVKLPVKEPAQTPDLVPSLRGPRDLDRALEGYAKAWADEARMQQKGLPILEHQRTALKRATLILDQVQPGASERLQDALTYEPGVRQGITQSLGKERVQQLRSALEHEARVRVVPELHAERVVKMWQGLEAERKQLRKSHDGPALEGVKERMQSLTLQIKNDPQLERALKEGGQKLGLKLGLRLGMVLQAPDIKRALSLTEKDLHRGLSLER